MLHKVNDCVELICMPQLSKYKKCTLRTVNATYSSIVEQVGTYTSALRLEVCRLVSLANHSTQADVPLLLHRTKYCTISETLFLYTYEVRYLYVQLVLTYVYIVRCMYICTYSTVHTYVRM